MEQLTQVLTNVNTRHSARKIWTCAEPNFKLIVLQYDNYYIKDSLHQSQRERKPYSIKCNSSYERLCYIVRGPLHRAWFKYFRETLKSTQRKLFFGKYQFVDQKSLKNSFSQQIRTQSFLTYDEDKNDLLQIGCLHRTLLEKVCVKILQILSESFLLRKHKYTRKNKSNDFTQSNFQCLRPFFPVPLFSRVPNKRPPVDFFSKNFPTSRSY